MRRCILSGEEMQTRAMVRFVPGPEDALVPDIAGRLPGRGVWLKADGAGLASALTDGSLLRRVRHSLKQNISGDGLDAGLPDRLAAGLESYCLSIVGLARGAGHLAAGFEAVRGALLGRKAHLLLIASDAGADSGPKLLSFARGVGRTLYIVDLFDRAALGQAIGRENAVYAAVTSSGMAARIADEALRLAAFRGKAMRTIVPEGADERDSRAHRSESRI